MAPEYSQVAEMPGLYGPFTLTERVLQKIWLQGDFDLGRAVLTDGRRLIVRYPGRWNLLGGPDFQDARLSFTGTPVAGDVEVHFQSQDWMAHGHGKDPAYAQVELHVLLFPLPEGVRAIRHSDGRTIPSLVLLPLLHRDLEEYAADDALETITARDEWRHFAELAGRPVAAVRELLRGKAAARWRQKVHFAGRRIERLGWVAAAHHTALEILGYRQNRAAMLTLAARYPLELWPAATDVPGIFAEGGAFWQLQGVRPANHPLARLRQYQVWTAARRDWPARLLAFAEKIFLTGGGASMSRPVRVALALPELRQSFADEITAGAVGGMRLDNLVCDGFLPLLTAVTGRDHFSVWFHWYLGDAPDRLKSSLARLGVTDGRMQPVCHGYGQGLLGWILERESRASAWPAENLPHA